VDVARMADGDGIFIDDEGLLTMNKDTRCFGLTDEEGLVLERQCLAGRGLVLGCDDEGETVAPKITLDELRRRVVWLDPFIGRRLAARLLSMSGEVRVFESAEKMQDYLECARGRR
jgi:hypothetical protein